MVEPLVANETVVSSNLITRSTFPVLAAPNSRRHRIFRVLFFLAALISTIAALRPAPSEPILGGHDKLAHGLVFLFLAMLLDTAIGDFGTRTVILLASGGGRWGSSSALVAPVAWFRSSRSRQFLFPALDL